MAAQVLMSGQRVIISNGCIDAINPAMSGYPKSLQSYQAESGICTWSLKGFELLHGTKGTRRNDRKQQMAPKVWWYQMLVPINILIGIYCGQSWKHPVCLIPSLLCSSLGYGPCCSSLNEQELFCQWIGWSC